MVKFLLLRFSSIGDIVLTTPLIRCLKEQVEGAEVHFLTKTQFVPLLQANPYLDRIHALQDNSEDTIRELKEEQYDYILDLHNNIRSLNIKRSLRRMYFTLNKLNLKKWLMVNFKINRLPDLHMVDRNLDTFAQMGPVKAGHVGPGIDLGRCGDDPLPLRKRLLLAPQVAVDRSQFDAGFLRDLAQHRLLGCLLLHRAGRDLDPGEGMLQQQQLEPLVGGTRDKGRDLLDSDWHCVLGLPLYGSHRRWMLESSL